MSDLQKAVDQVRNARWEAWKRMAKKLPDRHILSVELFRTEQDETLAVFTVVKNGQPVQEVLRANSRGVGVKAVVYKHEHKCEPIQVWPMHHVEAVRFDALAAAPSDDVIANGIPLGEPPPKQDPEPGVISLATVMMPSAFDVGERLTDSATTQRK